jgi:hypothetical protein
VGTQNCRSGLDFADRGERELKGVPGTWRLFALKGLTPAAQNAAESLVRVRLAAIGMRERHTPV